MKQEISWIGLTKLLHAKKKKETGGKESISLKDILPEAKKVWAGIKAGTDPTYTQGKQAPGKRSSTKKTKKTTGKSKSNTTKKMKEGGSAGTAEVKALLKECHLCKKCSKKVDKVLGQKGGEYGTNDTQSRESNTFSEE